MREISLPDGIVLYLYVVSTHVIKWHRVTHRLNTNVSFLVLILYYIVKYMQCNYRGKLGERYTGSLYYLCNFL